MNNTLTVELAQTFDHRPLAIVDGLPGDYAELTPARLRALAAALERIAADAESRPLVRRSGKPMPAEQRVYPLQDNR